MKNSIASPEDLEKAIEVEAVKNLNESMENFEKVSKKLYSMKTDESDKNLYNLLVEKLLTLNKDSAIAFTTMIEKIDPDIMNKKDVVQRLTISGALNTYLYSLKAANDKIHISSLLATIPFYADDDQWLKVMRDTLLPHMVNNKML